MRPAQPSPESSPKSLCAGSVLHNSLWHPCEGAFLPDKILSLLTFLNSLFNPVNTLTTCFPALPEDALLLNKKNFLSPNKVTKTNQRKNSLERSSEALSTDVKGTYCLLLVPAGLVGSWLIVCGKKQLLHVSSEPCSSSLYGRGIWKGCQHVSCLMLLTLESRELIQHQPLQEEETVKSARAMGVLGTMVTGWE